VLVEKGVPSCPGTDASPKETDAIIPNGVQAVSLTLTAVGKVLDSEIPRRRFSGTTSDPG